MLQKVFFNYIVMGVPIMLLIFDLKKNVLIIWKFLIKHNLTVIEVVLLLKVIVIINV